MLSRESKVLYERKNGILRFQDFCRVYFLVLWFGITIVYNIRNDVASKFAVASTAVTVNEHLTS